MTNKAEKFAEFFQVQEPIKAVLENVEHEQIPTSLDALETDIPPLFRLANEVNTIEQSALRPLRVLGESADELARYLSLQSRKIDLILSHILLQENEKLPSINTHSFGGAGFVVNLSDALEKGQNLRCRLFLEHEAAAIYCYGEVIEVKQEQDTYAHKVLLTLIREADQELLVRASLHAQTRQLKKHQ